MNTPWVIAVVAALSFCCVVTVVDSDGFSTRLRIGAVASTALTAIIAALYQRTLRRTPDATFADVAADGGKLYRLPDGRFCEYFEFGDPTGVPLVIAADAKS